jgi:hypothetical protein
MSFTSTAETPPTPTKEIVLHARAIDTTDRVLWSISKIPKQSTNKWVDMDFQRWTSSWMRNKHAII